METQVGELVLAPDSGRLVRRVKGAIGLILIVGHHDDGARFPEHTAKKRESSPGGGTRGRPLIYRRAMDPAELTRLTAETLYLVLLVSAPPLLVALGIGLVVGLLQAVTQVQEQTLSFVPKLVAVATVLVIGGGWMGGQLLRFTERLWTAIPELM